MDSNGLAVQSFALLTEGSNRVASRIFPDALGLENDLTGFHLNTNVQINFDEGDDLDVYTVERDAITSLLSRTFEREGRKTQTIPAI